MRSKSPGQAHAPAALGVQARRLRALLVDLSRRRPVRDPVAAACEDLGLTPVQIHIVAWLGQDGPLTMGALARRVAVTEKTITGVVDRLERDDLVQRTRDPGDRRVVHVRLAGRGAELFRRIDAEIEAKLTALLALLDGGDRQHLLGMLEKLAARLAGHAAEEGHPPAPAGTRRRAAGQGKPSVGGTSTRRLARPEEA
jgi:DNA-binding MarR family transcriptional regulator